VCIKMGSKEKKGLGEVMINDQAVPRFFRGKECGKWHEGNGQGLVGSVRSHFSVQDRRHEERNHGRWAANDVS